MIPADVASRLRLVLPDQPAPAQPAAAGGKLTDILSDLVPGQRLMAEIQALLPNGAYRATIAQRDVILALPFSAKSGDSLELEVVESDGKLSLAFLANRSPGEQASAPGESVATSLSQTGRLIGELMAGIDPEHPHAPPAVLNANQPLFNEVPDNAADLVPVLKDALSNSGMFYEAHQARWVEGKLPTEALLQEPQGKLSSLPGQHTDAIASASSTGTQAISQESPTRAGMTTLPPAVDTDSPLKTTLSSPISPDLAPLVRQQLDALATQNYVWQGQVWPGQQMYWEIGEDGSRREEAGANPGQRWQTRLKLALPGLGGVDAIMRLQPNGALDVSLVADSASGRAALVAGSDGLRRQLEDAGLNLTAFSVHHDETAD